MLVSLDGLAPVNYSQAHVFTASMNSQEGHAQMYSITCHVMLLQ